MDGSLIEQIKVLECSRRVIDGKQHIVGSFFIKNVCFRYSVFCHYIFWSRNF